MIMNKVWERARRLDQKTFLCLGGVRRCLGHICTPCSGRGFPNSLSFAESVLTNNNTHKSISAKLKMIKKHYLVTLCGYYIRLINRKFCKVRTHLGKQGTMSLPNICVQLMCINIYKLSNLNTYLILILCKLKDPFFKQDLY